MCFPIIFYQKIIRPVLPSCCRFYPCCSDYAIQSLQKFGIIKGIKLTLYRLSKCHPFHSGGVDFIP